MNLLKFDYTRERIFPGFDGVTCKINPKIMKDNSNTAIMTYSMLLLSGMDVGVDNYAAKSTDGGITFDTPVRLTSGDVYVNGIRSCLSDQCTFYNPYCDKWFVFCHRCYYADNKTPVVEGGIAVGEAVWTTFDPDSCDWDVQNVKPLPLPFETVSAFPHGQCILFENGDMLLTFFVITKTMKKAGVISVRYAYENGEMHIVRAGTLLKGDKWARGLCEPSLACLNGKYYLTLRSDEEGLLSVSDDGYNFSQPSVWCWDDGSPLENYNTMQRWIRNSRGLYLAYTRRGAHNDHVFRHRAPMFMARFDEDRRCLIRESEVILVPEMGARLGNFSVTDVSDNEAWLTTAEWMQPCGCEKYGSDNSIWIARIYFE